MNDEASSHLGCLPCTWWDRGDRTEGLVAKAGRWCLWTRHWRPVRPCDSAGPNKKDIVFVGGVWILKGSRAIFAAEASGKKELDAVCPYCNLSRVRVHLGRLRGSISAWIVASIDVTRSPLIILTRSYMWVMFSIERNKERKKRAVLGYYRIKAFSQKIQVHRHIQKHGTRVHDLENISVCYVLLRCEAKWDKCSNDA